MEGVEREREGVGERFSKVDDSFIIYMRIGTEGKKNGARIAPPIFYYTILFLPRILLWDHIAEIMLLRLIFLYFSFIELQCSMNLLMR